MAFFVLAGVFYFVPFYLGKFLSNYIFILIFLVFGMFLLGSVLKKLGKAPGKIIGIDDMALGTVFILFWFFTYTEIPAFNFPTWILNLIILPVLFFGSYGVSLGIIKNYRYLFIDKKQFWIKLPVVFVQLLTLLASVLAIFEFYLKIKIML